jgi:hypothetical protein
LGFFNKSEFSFTPQYSIRDNSSSYNGSENISSKLKVLEKKIVASKISPVKAAQNILEEFKKTI